MPRRDPRSRRRKPRSRGDVGAVQAHPETGVGALPDLERCARAGQRGLRHHRVAPRGRGSPAATVVGRAISRAGAEGLAPTSSALSTAMPPISASATGGIGRSTTTSTAATAPTARAGSTSTAATGRNGPSRAKASDRAINLAIGMSRPLLSAGRRTTSP